ncbi:hypothetical protein ASPWEDRAFT_50251 [Aspergillus wentii DTO 134E9]|uniref:Serine-threonine protein kinase 19 n=1 Tax=Aspergillus wentii DTO 134E9 TaxID=1073089 RepID=A0A1L9RPE2_ASPWE|nr:uncharacterized protein ASPWEDRAFT_50251 [Aspergillus wentii DTO 134E9]OJJ36815.1 hypothetical protein ASPWEDRAFT_50251 [Aspergillus wentii DTO 134E9]
MPLRITSAPVSGIRKNRKSTTLKSQPSPFAGHARRKPTQSSKSDKLSAVYQEDDSDQLPDIGVSRYISETAPVGNVTQALKYIQKSMFEDVPTRAGMNSTRIAEVLNLRRSLPPLVSVAHVHTLLDAPTMVEREIVDLVNTGRVRRLIVPGRGNDAAGLGDCLVLAEDWEGLVRGNRFLEVLGQIGTSSAIPGGTFSPEEYMALVRAGFLVSSSSLAKGSLGVASLPSLPSSSSATSASRGDTNGWSQDDILVSRFQFHTATLFLSLPNIGPYLRLLGTGRTHLISLLKKSSSTEVPLYLLCDRWDGAVETDKSFNMAKRARGEYAGILPGRTKKWKDLYGMNFRWALEEALGAGLVEIFDTGSVGPGIRCL